MRLAALAGLTAAPILAVYFPAFAVLALATAAALAVALIGAVRAGQFAAAARAGATLVGVRRASSPHPVSTCCSSPMGHRSGSVTCVTRTQARASRAFCPCAMCSASAPSQTRSSSARLRRSRLHSWWPLGSIALLCVGVLALLGIGTLACARAVGGSRGVSRGRGVPRLSAFRGGIPVRLHAHRLLRRAFHRLPSLPPAQWSSPALLSAVHGAMGETRHAVPGAFGTCPLRAGARCRAAQRGGIVRLYRAGVHCDGAALLRATVPLVACASGDDPGGRDGVHDERRRHDGDQKADARGVFSARSPRDHRTSPVSSRARRSRRNARSLPASCRTITCCCPRPSWPISPAISHYAGGMRRRASRSMPARGRTPFSCIARPRQ